MQIDSYAVHDITAETFTFPFFAHNEKIAIRILHNMVKTPGTSLHDNPEDFRLYKIGFYDDQNGRFTSCDPEYIVRASDLVTRSLPGVDNEDFQSIDESSVATSRESVQNNNHGDEN